MPQRFVIGVDIGGTSTRAVLVDTGGTRRGHGRAAGGSPTAHPPATAAARLAEAVGAALDGHDPTLVEAAVLGMAGGGRLAHPDVRAIFDAAWHGAGLRCPYQVVGDAVVAYAAGTAATDGTVLIAGTGAIAARVSDFDLVHVADGHGWLLGDSGSGFWLGRQAVRTTLAGLDRLEPLSGLACAIFAELLPDQPLPADPATAADPTSYRRLAGALVNHVVAGPPIALAALAPLVLTCAQAGDPVAARLVDAAAGHLTATVAVVREPGDNTPIVLAGGLITSATALATRLEARLTAAWPGASRSPAIQTAAAAAWLALRSLPGTDPARLTGLHTRLVDEPATTVAAG